VFCLDGGVAALSALSLDFRKRGQGTRPHRHPPNLHEANILDPDMDSAGIGIAERNGQLFAVEDFSQAFFGETGRGFAAAGPHASRFSRPGISGRLRAPERPYLAVVEMRGSDVVRRRVPRPCLSVLWRDRAGICILRTAALPQPSRSVRKAGPPCSVFFRPTPRSVILSGVNGLACESIHGVERPGVCLRNGAAGAPRASRLSRLGICRTPPTSVTPKTWTRDQTPPPSTKAS
jgi:hypothetical protein